MDKRHRVQHDHRPEGHLQEIDAGVFPKKFQLLSMQEHTLNQTWHPRT